MSTCGEVKNFDLRKFFKLSGTTRDKIISAFLLYFPAFTRHKLKLGEYHNFSHSGDCYFQSRYIRAFLDFPNTSIPNLKQPNKN